MRGMEPVARKRLGFVLVGLGLVVIVATVIWVLEVANGPGQPRSFAERRSYNQTKVAIHEIFPQAMGVALVGLGIAWAGSRQIDRAGREAGEDAA